MNPTNSASLGHAFRAALAGEGLSIIAEIKRRSPSRGPLNLNADAASLARQYRDGNAACLSVLTDSDRFGGSLDDLREASKAVDIPVLRKDFLKRTRDVNESVAMGAAAILVIFDDVSRRRLRVLQDQALSLGLDVLTEVRTEEELARAVDCGAYMIAVNQRNDPKNSKPTVEHDKAEKIASMFGQLDDGIIKVAASGMGVAGGTSLRVIADAGYDAALIGEALVTASDPAAKLRELLASCGSQPPVLSAAHS